MGTRKEGIRIGNHWGSGIGYSAAQRVSATGNRQAEDDTRGANEKRMLYVIRRRGAYR